MIDLRDRLRETLSHVLTLISGSKDDQVMGWFREDQAFQMNITEPLAPLVKTPQQIMAVRSEAEEEEEEEDGQEKEEDDGNQEDDDKENDGDGRSEDDGNDKDGDEGGLENEAQLIAMDVDASPMAVDMDEDMEIPSSRSQPSAMNEDNQIDGDSAPHGLRRSSRPKQTTIPVPQVSSLPAKKSKLGNVKRTKAAAVTSSINVPSETVPPNLEVIDLTRDDVS